MRGVLAAMAVVLAGCASVPDGGTAGCDLSDGALGDAAFVIATARASPSAQRAVADGENEMLAARALLETLALDGLIVTGDAMHAHEAPPRSSLDRGGDYLFALKANRPAMLRDVEAFFADPPAPLEVFETTDAGHGRIETRRHRVTHSMPGSSPTAATPASPPARSRHPRPRRGRPAPSPAAPPSPPATISAPPASPRSPSPEPSAPTGRSRTACTGSSTSPSTRTAPETAATTAPKTSPSSAASPSTSSTRHGRRSPSPENENAPDGPTPSLEPSSAKCDSPARWPRRPRPGRRLAISCPGSTRPRNAHTDARPGAGASRNRRDRTGFAARGHLDRDRCRARRRAGERPGRPSPDLGRRSLRDRRSGWRPDLCRHHADRPGGRGPRRR